MSFFRTIFIVLFLFAISCNKEDDPDFTFDVTGDFVGQIISSSDGLVSAVCSLTRDDKNVVRVEFEPSTAAAGFKAAMIEVTNGYVFEIEQQLSTDSVRFVRGLNQFEQSADAFFNTSTNRLQIGIQVSNNASFSSVTVLEFTGEPEGVANPTKIKELQ